MSCACVASERLVERPVLRGLIQETANKSTSDLEKCLKSLEDKLKAATLKANKSTVKNEKGGGTKSAKSILRKKGKPTALTIQTPKKKSTGSKAAAQADNNQQQRHQTSCLIQWEEGRTAHQLAQVDSLAERETQESYGFLPNLEISIHLNARHVLGDTPPDVYFAHFTNKTFHDSTPGKSLAVAAAFLLGFGLKFIPVPKKSLWPNDIKEGIDCFDLDMFLKIHFEEDDKEDEPYEKLRVKSTWKPDQPPFKICQRLGNFECAMQRQFVSKRGKSNLIKFQAGILEKSAITRV